LRQELFTPDEDAVSIELGRLFRTSDRIEYQRLIKYPGYFAIRCNMSYNRAEKALAGVLEKSKKIYFD
jgi:hypothetical protein